MVKPVFRDGKAEVLAGSRTLNPRPGAVTDELFAAEEFFDARDLVQVKYEMVRKTDVEDVPVAAAAMTAVGDGPTVAGTAEAVAPQPATMTAMSAERMRKPAGRRRARVGIIGPLARVAIDAKRGSWHGTTGRTPTTGEDQPVGIMPACPFLARVRAALPRGRRPDFRRCVNGGHRSGTVPESHRLRDHAAGW